MAAQMDPFEYLLKLPTFYSWGLLKIPKPLNHPDDSNKIIITTNASVDGGIYELDLISNELKRLHKYDEKKLCPMNAGHFIDAESKTLFIFGGRNESFGAFNLVTKKMNYDGSNLLKICGKEPRSYFIEGRNELHVINNEKKHFIFKCMRNHKFRMVSSRECDFTFNSELLYSPFDQKLITIGNQCVIFEKYFYDGNFMEYVLNTSSSGWNIRTRSIKGVPTWWQRDIILGFEDVIFVFYWTTYNHDIYCYHLLDNKLYKLEYELPTIMLKYGYTIPILAVKDDNNNAHILNFETGKHVKVDLFKLIPKELLKTHRRYYKSLIMGYLKEKENQSDIPCIPFVLKMLILNFYSL